MPFKRLAIVVHRWPGVSLCLFFLLWFPSGIGMMYWDFPSVTGADRLDMSFGLIFGLGAATWAFSGMLSMDPFPTGRTVVPGARPGAATSRIPQALRQRPELAAFAGTHPRDVLADVADLHLKELEFTSFAGEPVYLAHLGSTTIVPRGTSWSSRSCWVAPRSPSRHSS
jgi:hypothetical protein